MEKAVIIKFGKLTNEEVDQFGREFRLYIDEFNPIVLGITEFIPKLVELHDEIHDSIEDVQSSPNTFLLEKADFARGETYNSIRSIIRSYLKYYDPAKKEAARKLDLILKHYGYVTRKGMDSETALIRNFLQEIRDNYSFEINLLNLQDDLNRLEAQNDVAENLSLERTKEKASKRRKHSMKELRKFFYDEYKKIIKRIEALIEVSGGTVHCAFLDRLNERVIHYNNVVDVRDENNKSKREKKEQTKTKTD